MMAAEKERILDLEPYLGSENMIFPYHRYFWRSCEEILLVRPNPDAVSARQQMLREKLGIPNSSFLPGTPMLVPVYWELLGVNLSAKASSYVSIFNRNRDDALMCYEGGLSFWDKHRIDLFPPPSIDLSPCRRWLSWSIGQNLGSPTARWAVASVDGQHLHVSSEEERISRRIPFLRDGKTWVTFHYRSGSDGWLGIHNLVLQNSESPEKKRTIEIPDFSKSEFLGLTRKGSLFLLDSTTGEMFSPMKAIKIWQISLGSSDNANVSSIAIDMPEERYFHEVAISPDGTELAWILSAKDQPEEELWVSDIIGNRFQRIAKLNKPRNLADTMLSPNLPARPSGLKWIPDQRKVSYLFENAVWRISVD